MKNQIVFTCLLLFCLMCNTLGQQTEYTTCSDSILITNPVINSGDTIIWDHLFIHQASFIPFVNNQTLVTNLSPGNNSIASRIVEKGGDTISTHYNVRFVVVDNPPKDTTIYNCNDSIEIVSSLDSFYLRNSTTNWTVILGQVDVISPEEGATWVKNIHTGKTLLQYSVNKDQCILNQKVTLLDEIKPFAGNDTILCYDRMKLNAFPKESINGSWSASRECKFINNTFADTHVENLPSGLTTLYWEAKENGCTEKDSINIQSISAAAAELVKYSDTICGGDVVMEAIEPDTKYVTDYFWEKKSGPGTISNINNIKTTISGITQNRTECIWVTKFDQQGTSCSDTASFIIINNDVTAVVSRDTVEICSNTSIITAFFPEEGEYGWWENKGQTGIINSTTNARTYVTDIHDSINVYTWWVRHGKCIDHKDLVLINLQREVNAFAEKDTVCSPENTLHATTTPEELTGYWQNMGGDGVLSSSTSKTTSVVDLASGLNRFVWTTLVQYDSTHVFRFCRSSDTVDIINYTIETIIGKDLTNNSNVYDVCLGQNDQYPLYALPPWGDGMWHSPDGTELIFDTPTHFNSGVSGLGYGIHTIVWTVNDRGCTDSDTIFINNLGFAIEAGNNIEICTDTAVLNAQFIPDSMGIGKWTIDTTLYYDRSKIPVIESPFSNTTKVRNLQPGSNPFKWEVKNEICRWYDMVDVLNNSQLSFAGEDLTICNDAALLSAKSPEAYLMYDDGWYGQWSILKGNGLFYSKDSYSSGIYDANARVSGLNEGVNKFTWTLHYGDCSAVDTVAITSLAINAQAGKDQATCDDEISLNAAQPRENEVGFWMFLNDPGYEEVPVIEDSTQPVTAVSNLSEGKNSFLWTMYDSRYGCVDGDTVSIFNNSIEHLVHAGGDTLYANDNSGTIHLQANPLINNTFQGTWHVQKGLGLIQNEDVHKSNAMVQNPSPGVNIFSWVVHDSSTGCQAEDTVLIWFGRIPVDAGPDRFTCEDSIPLDANEPEFGMGEWTVIKGNCVVKDKNNNITTAIKLSRGENLLQWNIKAYDYIASDTILIYNLGFQTNAGPDDSICNDSYTLQAQHDSTALLRFDATARSLGTWIFLKNAGNAHIPENEQHNPFATIPDLNTDAYTLLWEVHHYYKNDSLICSAQDTVSIIKLTDCSSGYHSQKKSTIHIYPNPVDNLLYIQSSNKRMEDVQISLISIEGKKVLQTTESQLNEIHTIDVSGLPVGLYVLQIITKSSTYISKIKIK